MGVRRVLVVHDDADFVDRLKSGLEAEAPFVEVQTALSAPRALGMIGAEKPDAVVVEAGLVGMDGYALTTQLTSDPITAQIPVIIVLLNPDESSAMKARQAGAKAHLSCAGAVEPMVAKLLDLIGGDGEAGNVPVPAPTAPQQPAAVPSPPPAAAAGPQPALGLSISEIPAGMAPPLPQTVPVTAPLPEPSAEPVASPMPTPIGVPAASPVSSRADSVSVRDAEGPASDVPHVDDLLRLMLERNGSDLHISVGSPPAIRQRGELVRVEDVKTLTPRDTQQMIFTMLSEEQRRRFDADLELDFAYSIPGVSRFRANVFQQRNSIGAVFRVIPIKIPTMEELGLPRVCKYLAERPRGLVLVTGPTGSGKSTTLASMINHINTTRAVHIITMEDPIEFMHPNKKAMINQREVGEDTHSFSDALRRVLRQDPDVILVGELRDLETISAAITAAETGHLVLATLHTTGGPETVDRVIDVFPPHQQQQVRMQLSTTLEGVLSQTLLRSTDGRGRVMAMEIMLGIPAISNLIREGKTHQMETIIQGASQLGMQTLDQSLKNLLTQGKVTFDEAISKAKNPRELAGMVGRKI